MQLHHGFIRYTIYFLECVVLNSVFIYILVQFDYFEVPNVFCFIITVYLPSFTLLHVFSISYSEKESYSK